MSLVNYASDQQNAHHRTGILLVSVQPRPVVSLIQRWASDPVQLTEAQDVCGKLLKKRVSSLLLLSGYVDKKSGITSVTLQS